MLAPKTLTEQIRLGQL